MDNRTIGLKITRLRETQGLTTTQLAEKVGLSQAQISRLENGKQGFRSATLSRIASALDVHPGFFFLDNGAENNCVLSPRVAEAMKRTEFAGFVERAAARFIEQPQILSELSRALEK